MSQKGDQDVDGQRPRRRSLKALLDEIQNFQHEIVSIEHHILDNVSKMKPDELSSIHDKLRNLNLSYKTTSEELEKHYSGIGSASEVIEVVQERREFLRNTSGVNRAINAHLQNLEEDMCCISCNYGLNNSSSGAWA